MEKILEKLIAFDTTTNQSNLDLIEFSQKIFEKNGYKIKLQRSGDCANLFAFKTTSKPRIILSAHTDTVPTSDNWKTDPYHLIKKDGRYYGLGVCDMKIFIAIMLDLAKKNLPENIAFLLTFNEELDFAGAKMIDKNMINHNDLIVIGEPTNNKAVLANKGVLAYKIQFIGPGGHGSESLPELSTIEQAAFFIQNFRIEFQKFALKNKDDNFSNSLPALNFGRVSGGGAINKIAENTEIIFEMRINDKQNEIEIENLLNKITGQIKCKTKIEKFFTYPIFKANNNIERLLKETKIPIGKGASFATEAGLMTNLSSNIIIFGPGEIKNAHQKDESIKIKNIVAYQKLLEKIVFNEIV